MCVEKGWFTDEGSYHEINNWRPFPYSTAIIFFLGSLEKTEQGASVSSGKSLGRKKVNTSIFCWVDDMIGRDGDMMMKVQQFLSYAYVSSPFHFVIKMLS